MAYFEFLEEYRIVNNANGTIRGCMDEWFEGMQLSNKLKTALCWEEDENYETLQQDKYSNEFIFCLLKFLTLGGGLSQHDPLISEYLECVKLMYKDLICVAKDSDSGEISPQSLVFKISAATGQFNLKAVDHPQNFFYVLIDPTNWHATLMHNVWTPVW